MTMSRPMAQGKYNATAACKIALRAEGRFYYPDILVGERLIFHVSDGGQVEDVPTIAMSSSVLNLKRKLEAPSEVPVLSRINLSDYAAIKRTYQAKKVDGR